MRLLIHDDLAHISGATHTLVLLGTADLAGKFHMPRGNGDQVLINTARSFITDATPLADQFLSVNLPTDFLETLQTHTDLFEAAVSTKSTGVGAQAGATAGIADTAHDAAIALHILDTLVRNTFKNDAQKLAEWIVASHIQRAPKHAAKVVAVKTV